MDKYLLRVTLILVVWLATASLASAQTTVEYIHTDALGTPVAVTNSAGAVIERSVYEPYGQLINRPLTDGPGFTGHVQDAATGLTYMQQRYYDPMLGRFLSRDPVTASSKTGANFNAYWYANNNPYKFTDPDGRAVSCANGSCTMTADTFNPAKSNGQTVLASPDVKAAANAAISQFTVSSGKNESLGFIVRSPNGQSVAQPAANVQTGNTSSASTASAAIPSGAQAVIHGHIDGGAYKSNGMVDEPKANKGYGDTQSLKAGMPTATVSQGQVGWHEINNGQLQFTYPQGALSTTPGPGSTLSQEQQMQKNLNLEQKKF